MKPRWLIGCECSGRVRSAMRARGVDAWSCDLKPAEDGDRHHIHDDVRDHFNDGWDGGIFHPDCTYLCNSGVRWLEGGHNVIRWVAMGEACDFFLEICGIPKIGIENPVMHRYAKERIGIQQTQTVQPWWFGDPERKATCLWLRGLPPLVKSDVVLPLGNSVHHEPPGPDRKANRSRTFPGLARAFAEQWGASPSQPRSAAPDSLSRKGER